MKASTAKRVFVGNEESVYTTGSNITSFTEANIKKHKNQAETIVENGFGFRIKGNWSYVNGHDVEKSKLAEICRHCTKLCKENNVDSHIFVSTYGVKGRVLIGYATKEGVSFVSCTKNGGDPRTEFTPEESTRIEEGASRILGVFNYHFKNQHSIESIFFGEGIQKEDEKSLETISKMTKEVEKAYSNIKGDYERETIIDSIQRRAAMINKVNSVTKKMRLNNYNILNALPEMDRQERSLAIEIIQKQRENEVYNTMYNQLYKYARQQQLAQEANIR